MSRPPSELARGRASARVGSVLCGKWRVDRVLGIGGTAAVYSATHRNGNRVAIKVLDATLVHEADICARFRNEGYAVNRINHPGVARVLDDDVTEDGCFFLVMDLLLGRSLHDHILSKGPLGVDESLFITDQVLDVLRLAHELGILHRDIKPANVFLTRDDTVKVLDFGIARIRGLVSEELGRGVTAAGQIMGTPAYMSPEQARGRWEEVDVPSDLWSVGATLFTMLTGMQPRSADSPNEELLLAMTAPMSSASSYRENIDPALLAFIERSVEMDRTLRFQTAEEMQRALRALTGGSAPAVRLGMDREIPSLPAVATNPTDFETTEETAVAPIPVPEAPPTAPDHANEALLARDVPSPVNVLGPIPATYRSREHAATASDIGDGPASSTGPRLPATADAAAVRDRAPSWRVTFVGAGLVVAGVTLIYFFVASHRSAAPTVSTVSAPSPPAANAVPLALPPSSDSTPATESASQWVARTHPPPTARSAPVARSAKALTPPLVSAPINSDAGNLAGKDPRPAVLFSE